MNAQRQNSRNIVRRLHQGKGRSSDIHASRHIRAYGSRVEGAWGLLREGEWYCCAASACGAVQNMPILNLPCLFAFGGEVNKAHKNPINKQTKPKCPNVKPTNKPPNPSMSLSVVMSCSSLTQTASVARAADRNSREMALRRSKTPNNIIGRDRIRLSNPLYGIYRDDNAASRSNEPKANEMSHRSIHPTSKGSRPTVCVHRMKNGT